MPKEEIFSQCLDPLKSPKTEFLSNQWIRLSGLTLHGILQASLTEKIENVMFSQSEMDT